MSREQLHDLLAQLKEQRKGVDLVDGEYYQRLDEIVESLEQQQLYPDTFDQYSILGEQVRELIHDYELEHPAFKSILDSIHQLLNNFRA